eukprot:COSAG03_NODE_4394_length_1567_cov_10.668937_2_plen_89_part_00
MAGHYPDTCSGKSERCSAFETVQFSNAKRISSQEDSGPEEVPSARHNHAVAVRGSTGSHVWAAPVVYDVLLDADVRLCPSARKLVSEL